MIRGGNDFILESGSLTEAIAHTGKTYDEIGNLFAKQVRLYGFFLYDCIWWGFLQTLVVHVIITYHPTLLTYHGR